MKLSTISSSIIALFFAASKALADEDIFDWSNSNSQFHAGNCIRFRVHDMPDGDDRTIASLYKVGEGYVKTIRSWDEDRFDEDDSFSFTWCVDPSVRPGRYYIKIFSDEEDDDVSRSFTFTITNPVNRAPVADNSAFNGPNALNNGGFNPSLARPGALNGPYNAALSRPNTVDNTYVPSMARPKDYTTSNRPNGATGNHPLSRSKIPARDQHASPRHNGIRSHSNSATGFYSSLPKPQHNQSKKLHLPKTNNRSQKNKQRHGKSLH